MEDNKVYTDNITTIDNTPLTQNNPDTQEDEHASDIILNTQDDAHASAAVPVHDNTQDENTVQKAMHKVCDVMEFILAIIVGFALIFSLVNKFPYMTSELFSLDSTGGIILFLKEIMNIVVGIEFIKMLCKPNTDNVIEVIIFVVARHLIIGELTATDIFLSVVSISILFIVRQILPIIHKRNS